MGPKFWFSATSRRKVKIEIFDDLTKISTNQALRVFMIFPGLSSERIFSNIFAKIFSSRFLAIFKKWSGFYGFFAKIDFWQFWTNSSRFLAIFQKWSGFLGFFAKIGPGIFGLMGKLGRKFGHFLKNFTIFSEISNFDPPKNLARIFAISRVSACGRDGTSESVAISPKFWKYSGIQAQPDFMTFFFPYGPWLGAGGARRLRGWSPSACRAPMLTTILRHLVL